MCNDRKVKWQTEQEKWAEVYAKEQTGLEFARRTVTKPDWTLTRTKGVYADWDVTITHETTGKEVLVENKIRNKDANLVRWEGALIDVDKVEKVRELGFTAYVNQYFYINNETYSWPMSEAENWKENGWKKVQRWCRKSTFDATKVLKWVYLLPMDEKHRVEDVDISDYWKLYKHNYEVGMELYAARN